MLFRIVLVTILLGGTIAVDFTTLGELSNPRNLTLLVVIVSTYLLTIAYAFVLRRPAGYRHMPYVQIAADVGLSTILVMVTGGLDSVFVFLFFLNIISAAVVSGRKLALYTAAVIWLAHIFLLLIAIGFIPNAIMGPSIVGRPVKNLLFEVAINGTGGLLIALLAGYLARRLGDMTTVLAQQQVALEELRALNRDILASLSSGLLTINTDGNIIFFNQSAELITGRPAANVLNQSLSLLFPGIAATIANNDLPDSSLSFSPSDTRYQSHYTRPNGQSIYLGFTLSVLRSSTGSNAGYIVIFEDLSDIKRLESQMKRSERLAAVGELAAAIAHEIRNPLAAISGSAEMLRSMSKDTGDEAALIEIMVREVERLDKLITDFLAYCHPRPLRLEPTDLHDLITDVLALFQNQAPALKIDLELNHSPGHLAIALVDPEALRQVLWNLLKNAMEVEKPSTSQTPHIRVGLRSIKDHCRALWVISVEDNGPGIPTEGRKRIFEPFFTTKPQGTGLGLATIYRLIEEHGGTITVETSKALNGARFEVSLPESPPDQTVRHLAPIEIEEDI